MQTTGKKAIEVFVESVNFIVISYALSSMAMSFRTHWLYILFFASNVWLCGRYCEVVYRTVKNKWATGALFAACFAIFCALVYFVGYIDGEITPFSA